jgi:D-Tyr-tRNAtyr deacylase
LNNKIKLFISWSKDPAKEIAEQIKNRLCNTFSENEIEIFLSSDLRKGTTSGKDFVKDIMANLKDNVFGILVLTKYNIGAPWLMFELGSMANNEKTTNITPMYFGRPRDKIEEPLNKLNLESAIYGEENFEESFLKLIISIEKRRINDGIIGPDRELILRTLVENKREGFKQGIDKIITSYEERHIIPDQSNPKETEFIFPSREILLQSIFNDLKNNNTSRIIIVGGIATIIRNRIDDFIPWLEKNQKSKLFLCYENESTCIERLEQRKIKDASEEQREMLRNARYEEYEKSKAKEQKESLKNKIEGIRIVKDFHDSVKKNKKINDNQVNVFEVKQMLTSYSIIKNTTVYLTPLFHDRSSNSLAFKLTSHFAQKPLEYIKRIVNSDILNTEIDVMKIDINPNSF